METLTGFVETLEDAVILFEACRQGYLKRTQRRLTDTEKARIDSGSIWIWDEEEAQIKRWTDRRNWSPSRRMLDRFLVYYEIDRKFRGHRNESQSDRSPSDESTGRTSFDDGSSNSNSYLDGDADGEQQASFAIARKEGGLSKRCLSVTTADGRRQHLVAYYLEEDVAAGKLLKPMELPSLRGMLVDWRRYPDLVQSWPETLGNSMDYSQQLTSAQQPVSPSTWSPQPYPAQHMGYYPPTQHHESPAPQSARTPQWRYGPPASTQTTQYLPHHLPQHIPDGNYELSGFRPHYHQHVARPEHHRVGYHPYSHARPHPHSQHHYGAAFARHSPQCPNSCCRPAYNPAPSVPPSSFSAHVTPSYVATALRRPVEPPLQSSTPRVTLPSFSALIGASNVPRNGLIDEVLGQAESREQAAERDEFVRAGEWRRFGMGVGGRG